MTVKLLLDQKREGRELSSETIHELIAAYTRGEVPDYQMAAFAMAVCCKGMTDAETLALTEAMRDSGTCLDWNKMPTADKHSTGGVGDKLSLIIQPLAAACGLYVPSLTGRGLGLTGGTADKMESIPGYVAALPLADYRRVVSDCGCSLTVQTAEIAPADKKMYALRDVTGTVPSIPLIVGSILSKKLAEGADTLVFDVKCGVGAFMKTPEAARNLARALVEGAKGAGRKSAALVTAMDEPLGYAVGNAVEVQEALDILEGRVAPRDVVELSLEFAALMVSLELGKPLEAARELCRMRLADGSAANRFCRMVALQGGDLAAFAARPKPVVREVRAPRAGYVAHIDAIRVAQAAFLLGAGRAKADDVLDLEAGVRLCVKAGDKVESGEVIACVMAKDHADRLPQAAEEVIQGVSFSDTAPSPSALILERVM